MCLPTPYGMFAQPVSRLDVADAFYYTGRVWKTQSGGGGRKRCGNVSPSNSIERHRDKCCTRRRSNAVRLRSIVIDLTMRFSLAEKTLRRNTLARYRIAFDAIEIDIILYRTREKRVSIRDDSGRVRTFGVSFRDSMIKRELSLSRLGYPLSSVFSEIAAFRNGEPFVLVSALGAIIKNDRASETMLSDEKSTEGIIRSCMFRKWRKSICGVQ